MQFVKEKKKLLSPSPKRKQERKKRSDDNRTREIEKQRPRGTTGSVTENEEEITDRWVGYRYDVLGGGLVCGVWCG